MLMSVAVTLSRKEKVFLSIERTKQECVPHTHFVIVKDE